MIGFVGLGRMGLPMVRNLVAAGMPVRAVDVVPAAVERAAGEGIDASTDLATLADAEVVCSSLPDTAEVDEVYRGSLFEMLSPGTVCADLSTISIEGSRAIAAAGHERGVAFLDTPVSGTIPHAEAATLAIMAGGDAEALAAITPVLGVIGSSVHYFGPNGSGLTMKLITNRLLSACTAAIAETTVSLEANGLDTAEAFDFLAKSAVPKLIDYKGLALRTRDFTPTFTVGLMRKDLAHADGLDGPDRIARLVRSIFDDAAAQGHDDADIAAIIETWR